MKHMQSMLVVVVTNLRVDYVSGCHAHQDAPWIITIKNVHYLGLGNAFERQELNIFQDGAVKSFV